MRRQRGDSEEKLSLVPGFGGVRHTTSGTPSNFWMIWRHLAIDLLYSFHQSYISDKYQLHITRQKIIGQPACQAKTQATLKTKIPCLLQLFAE
jgi:hypothetical protein